jgi:hypothetical protein
MSKENAFMYHNLRDGLVSKPMFVPVNTDISKIISKDKDWYISLFKYTEEHKKRVEETSTVSGIKDTMTDILYFDFDNGSNLQIAREDAITLAERLIDAGIPEESIGCYFTGSKGFSVEVPIKQLITPEQFKNIVFHFAEDLTTFDLVVNDPNRIVRIANTKHQKSGLYKIQLTPEELVNMEIKTIRDLAKTPRDMTFVSTPATLDESLLTIKPISAMVDTAKKELTFDLKALDMKNKPKGIDDARWALMNGYFRTGDRHYAMLCLASTQKNFGYAPEHVRAFLESVADIQARRTGEDIFPQEELEALVKTVYSSSWQGGQFTVRDPNNWLAKYARKMGIVVKEENGPMSMDQIIDDFSHYIENLDANTIKTGIASLDKLMPITVGSAVGLVGAASSGKTAMALKILKNQSKSGEITVFASLDMHRNRLFEKALYNLTGLTREDLKTTFKDKRKEYELLVKREFGNVYFFDKSRASVDDIRQYVIEVEQTTSRKVKLVMIDYFERISSEVNDDTAASKRVASEIQDMTNDLNVATIVLVQPNKMSLGGGPDTEIKSYTSIKGSSFLYQSFRNILAISRPFFTPATQEFDNYLRINVLKNDLGELGVLDYHWTGRTGEVRELEDIERMELKELLKWKKEKAKASEDGGGWDD